MALADPLVMIVDDDDELTTILVDTLTARGYRTVVAENGKQALRRLGELDAEPPDLILLDLCMPEMDGWQLRHALAAQAGMAGVPIIVITGATDQDATGLAVVDIIPKPLSLDQLLTVIRRHLLDAELARPRED